MNEDDKGSFDDRINRARERMSTDYAAAPPRRAAASAPAAGGGVLAQLLSSDAGTRRLVYGAAGLGGLLVLGIGGWALVGHHQSGIPVLGPPEVSMRTKPVDPGGMQVDGLSTPEADDGQAHPVPAPEKPDPSALAAQYGQQAAKTAATEAPAPGSAAQPADQAKAAAAPATGQSAGPEGAAPGGTAAQATPATPEGTAQTDATQQPDSLPDSSTGVADESAAGDVAASAPAAAPAVPAASKPAPKVAAKKVAPEAAEPASPATSSGTTQPSAPAPVARAGGKFRVQLAALQTEAQAQQEWSRLKTHYPTLFADRTPVIEKVQRDNAVFYRLRVSGFGSVAETRSFCSAVRERGLGCTQVH
ncbi:SPOR domain-containing protein [Acetobacter farinalis]|uniref:SPOR domain-containing protein n=1 Tax=Acetobacter farinalis TaxID=1260984 RepID=A0ABT3Q9E3_9PROT|nr:SPOR domain-containing protein [Acetobacter farinalis]MCX2561896.1 SPOR domain-containing protein [Acetobacter farinalis]NHO30386.1 SPOR domain-containing protein [Acetobacter farinalis]